MHLGSAWFRTSCATLIANRFKLPVSLRKIKKGLEHQLKSLLLTYYGGEGGIRTHVELPPNGFQDRPVMTASVPLQGKKYFINLPREISYHRHVYYSKLFK